MRCPLPFLLLAGCTTVASVPSQVAPNVAAVAETDPVDTAADAADDPAIWRNRADPACSLAIGTDKKAGIHVYDLNGKRVSFTPAVRLNNVDQRESGSRVIAAATDRVDVVQTRVSTSKIDTSTRQHVD